MQWIRIVAAIVVVLALAALGLRLAAAGDIEAAHERLSSARLVAQTGVGPVAFETGGEGPAVLVLHGAGGGHDQGRLIAEALIGDGVRWIAPSRFGYPGTPLPADASVAAQADALVDLLNTLDVSRAHVVGFSGGAPTALQLAARHPARVDRLVLLSSAPFTPFDPDVPDRPIPTWLYHALFGSDIAYWLLQRIAGGALRDAFDARPALLDRASPAERTFVARVVDTFQPASARVDGIGNEAAAVAPTADYRLSVIVAPTLVIHARDDALNPFAVAEAIAGGITGAQLEAFATGGHLLLGHHDAARESIRQFIGPLRTAR